LWTEQTGTYKFYLKSDDGSRLYIDGNLVIDNDGLHAQKELSASVALSKGYHDIRVEYFENYGDAGISLKWMTPGSVAKKVVPSSVLFRDARGVVNLTTDASLFIPVATASGTVSVTGDVNVTPVSAQGLIGEFYNYYDSNVLNQIPGFVDGLFLRNQSADGLKGASVLTLKGLPEHTSLDVSFLLAIIDSWDGSGEVGPDFFNVEVDGKLIFSQTFSNVEGKTQTYVAPSGSELVKYEDRGFGTSVDSL
jgi:hypothetical protein